MKTEQEYINKKTVGDEIVSFDAVRKVKKTGQSGMVMIPKSLIGKFVKVTYRKETKRKK